MFDPHDRGMFLNLAGLFEGGLALLAFAIGWVVGISPLATLRFEWSAVMWGVLGTLPMLLLFVVSFRSEFAPLKTIRAILIQVLGPPLARCRWYDLILLAAMAGLGEELLFRGVLQPWFGGWGYTFGLIASNVIFGLAHAVTITYAVLAGGIGVYLGLIQDAPGEPNLLIPIITHAVYDWLAFLMVVAAYRARHVEPIEESLVDDQESI